MKIKLEIELEIPDECKEWSDGELSQYVFDNYTNYVTVQHSSQVLDCYDIKDDFMKQHMIDHHKEWADIGKSAKVKIIVL